jgi:hypothetical protein
MPPHRRLLPPRGERSSRRLGVRLLDLARLGLAEPDILLPRADAGVRCVVHCGVAAYPPQRGGSATAARRDARDGGGLGSHLSDEVIVETAPAWVDVGLFYGSFPPKRSPDAGDGCTANHFQPGLLSMAELDQIADARGGDPGICTGPG